MYLRHSLESRLALTLPSSCLHLQCVGITGVSHHTILSILEYVKPYSAHLFSFPSFSDLSIATNTYSTQQTLSLCIWSHCRPSCLRTCPELPHLPLHSGHEATYFLPQLNSHCTAYINALEYSVRTWSFIQGVSVPHSPTLRFSPFVHLTWSYLSIVTKYFLPYITVNILKLMYIMFLKYIFWKSNDLFSLLFVS